MNLWKRMTLIAVILTLVVMTLGAYVRLNDAGLGCPDWPGCYGSLSVPQSEATISKAQAVFPSKPLEVGKAWLEMTHRYIAGSLGLLTLVISAIAWQKRRLLMTAWWCGVVLVAVILFQATLGMWTVTFLLRPVVVSAHLIGGMSVLAILTWLYVRNCVSPIPVCSTIRLHAKIGVLILLGQIFLGGWTSSNYAGLACTDFPTCHGLWWPKMNFGDAFYLRRALGENALGRPLTLESVTAIQWTHRLGAGVTFLYLGMLSWKLIKQSISILRNWGIALITLLLMQIGLGIVNLILHLPLVLAVAHHFVAALLVVTLISLNALIIRPRTP